MPDPARLFLWPHLDRAAEPTADPRLIAARDRASAIARDALAAPEPTVDRTGHNWHLIRARRMQRRIVSLVVEWRRTGDRRFRDQVVADLRTMAGWSHWSWLAWRRGEDAHDAIFDLSYGENAASLALAYDALAGDLAADELAWIESIARERALLPYLHHAGGAKRAWWYDRGDTNWNAVCNGGAGMLALALRDRSAASARVLELVETGIAAFFGSLAADGAWPEGLGYWNYGMRYAFMYTLSHERATGGVHPRLARPETEATLAYPLLLTPNGVACGFGDVDRFAPMPFHLAAAVRYGRWDLVAELDRRLGGATPETAEQWPSDAELLLLHPRAVPPATVALPTHRLLAGVEWGFVADAMPAPALYACVRGGTTAVPHAHNDLMSFVLLVGDEQLIANVPADDYYDSTFGERRGELYEMSPAAKNTVFIDGIGPAMNARVATTAIAGDGWRGFRVDGTAAMGLAGAVAGSCHRLVLLLRDRALLVVDRIRRGQPSLMESRLHTFADAEFGAGGVVIRGRRRTLHVAHAAGGPFVVRRAGGMPTDPKRAPDTAIRCIGAAKTRGLTIATLLTPDAAGELALSEDDAGGVVRVGGPLAAEIRFSPTLEVAGARGTATI